jgi:hypothetical protein
MDFSRSHRRLFSLASSLMVTASVLATAPAPFVAAAAGPQPAALTGAMNGLKALGWAGAKDLAVPAPAASPDATTPAPQPAAKPHLTDAQFGILAKAMAKYGHKVTLYTDITGPLGIAGNITVDQLSLKIAPPDYRAHSIQFVPGTGDILFISTDVDHNLRASLADPQQKLIAAESVDQRMVATKLDPAKAQAELDIETTFWMNAADRAGSNP